MSNSRQFFSGRTTSQIEKIHLPEGFNEVTVNEVRFLNHRMDWDGNEREPEEGEYVDNTQQVGILLHNPVLNMSQAIRLNGPGFVHASDPDVDEEKVESGELQIVGRYVCEEDEEGNLVRQMSPNRTKRCESIINGFLNAAGVNVGEGVDMVDAFESIVGTGQLLGCTIYNDPFTKSDGTTVDNWKAKNFKPVSEPVTAAAGSDDLDA